MKKILCLVIFMFSCGEKNAEPQERVSKLRAIGVGVNPIIISNNDAGKQIEFVFHALLPTGESLSTQLFADEGGLAWPGAWTDANAVITYQEGSALRIAKVSIKSVLPDISGFFSNATFIPFVYGLTLISGSETENIVGKIPVFTPEESIKKQNFSILPSILITKPLSGASVGTEFDIEANISGRGDESYKIGWFLSGGKVVNRRALKSKVKELAAGSHTIVVTARGLTSGAFFMNYIDITVK